MNQQVEMRVGEFDQSIIELQKHKFKLLEQINMDIAFLRKQQEQLTNV